jgi:hypothetical protein
MTLTASRVSANEWALPPLASVQHAADPQLSRNWEKTNKAKRILQSRSVHWLPGFPEMWLVCLNLDRSIPVQW